MRLIKHIQQFKDGGGYMSLSIPERKKYITNYFITKGYTPVQAAAIVGNLQQENRSFDPNIKNSIGATGIAQWLGKGRKGILLQRENPYAIDTQLDFLHDELQGNVKGAWTNNIGGKEAFFNTDDINQATLIIRKDFERPGEYEANDKQRYKFAQEAISLVDPNYKFTPPQEQSQNQLTSSSYDIERQDLSNQAYLSAIEGKLNTATEELAKFQEERAQKQKKQETVQEEDTQRQVLQQAQQQKEEIYNLLTSNPPESLQYDVSPTQQAFSQIQPFQFQSDFYSGEGLFQEGGQVEFEEKIYELNPTLITANDFDSPKQFLQDYINSSNYKQRLINSGYSNVDELVQNRSNDVQGVELIKIQDKKPGIFKQLFNEITGEPYTTNGSVYNRDGNSVILDKQQTEFLQVPLTDVWTHEIGHSELSSIPLNDYDRNEIEKRLIINKNDNLHASDPEEIKADLNTIRYQLFKKNITDPKTKQINKEDIDQLDSSFIKDRLTDSVGEENLIWLLNNIAQNTSTQPITYAKSGGIISPLNKIKKKFQVGGEILPILNFNKFQYNPQYEIENLPEAVIYGENKKHLQNELEMIPNQTANTFPNMFGNVSTYFFGTEDSELIESPHKPTKSTDTNIKYYIRPGMKEDVYKDLTSEIVKKDYNHTGEFEDIFKALKSNGEDREHNASNSFSKNKVGYKGMYNLGSTGKLNRGQFNFGRYTVDAGEDEKGKYISFYDMYDWNGSKTKNPIPFYGRIYEDEWGDYKNKIKTKIEQEEKEAKKKNEHERKTLLLKHKL